MGYWLTIAIISSFCLGWRAVTDEGMVFFPIRKFFLDNYQYYDSFKINIAKPIVLCCTCMPSIWGTLIWWSQYVILQQSFHWWTIPVYVMSIITCSFINGFLWALYELVKKY